MRVQHRKSSRKRIRMGGFRQRMKTRGGRKILKSRRRLGRELCAAKRRK